MRKILSALLFDFDRVLKIAQIAALLFIGVELHDLAKNVYSGPGPLDPSAVDMTEVEEQLRNIARAIKAK